jgi:glycosyltransferase involved in cell wall biosynthesis
VVSRKSQFTVRFLLSTNLPSSITRITADTANVFARLGIPTTVVFPAVDWWDYKLFGVSRMGFANKCKQTLRLAGEVLINAPFRRSWCGLKLHEVDPRIKTTRFLISPSARKWGENGITVVHPPYLIPHLLRTMAHPRIKMVSAVHVNLEKAIQSSSPVAAAWYAHWVAFERFLSVPRYATSEGARKSAERLGIPVRKVIYGGIDLSLFHALPVRDRAAPLVITLYCDPNVQKGRSVGVDALKTLKSVAENTQLCSIGHVSAEEAKVFDHNYGYLHGEEYAGALQHSDIFVYPSLYDGFPAPPLQAMACGAALVTTAVEGVTEYGAHEHNCLLCEPGKAEAMRDQIVRLIEDRELRERLQANGPKTAEAFSVERSARQLLEFLREVYEE